MTAELGARAEDDDTGHAGGALVNLSFVGVGALLVSGVIGALAPDDLGVVTAVVAVACFVVGVALFLWGYARGVSRSREEAVTLGGLFFLAGSAPRVVRFRLRIALLLQVLVTGAVAATRPYTAVAFAVLGPMLGLGILAAWGARYGSFPTRESR